jgi:prepilin-type N-terminal cleavage/methylation domain-containing protein
MNERGMTLIEILVVATIITLLVLIVGFQFVGWQAKYKVETQLRVLHSDLMDMRMRAMRTNIMHFMNFIYDPPPVNSGKGYTVYVDVDGDGTPEPGGDDAGGVIMNLSKTALEYPLMWNLGGSPVNIQADAKGLMNILGTVWMVDKEGDLYSIDETLVPDEDYNRDTEVDYDCVVIARTRINMGKITDWPVKGGNCVAK